MTAPTFDDARPHRAAAKRVVRDSLLAERLQAGEPFEDAVASLVRSHLAAGEHVVARALGQSLQRHPTTRIAGYLASALVAAKNHLPELAWASFRELPPHIWRRLAAEEYLRVAFSVDRAAAVIQARQLIAECPPELTPEAWIAGVKLAFGARDEQLAEDLFNVTEKLAADSPEAWADTSTERDWLRPWFGRVLRPPPAPSARPGHIMFGVMDYKQPDRKYASTNIGDYVQTLAALGHVVRHQGLSFHSETPGLAEAVTELQGRVRPELRIESAHREVTLVPINRDATNYDVVPDNTWAVLFGWHMQSMFDLRHDFPPNPNLRPIIISFHCNRPDMLTPAALEYLRENGPVGCRDWTTVDILLSAGVRAFFSGCITTTISTVFPEVPAPLLPSSTAPTVYVDVKAPEGGLTITQQSDAVRNDSLVTNLREVVGLMERYRRDYSSIVTSRLHCYLPCRSIGAEVEFVPPYSSDVRFNGLYETTDQAYFESMRDRIMEKLQAVLTAVFAGKSEHEVRQVWHDVCSEDVAIALARRDAVAPLPPPSFDVGAACATVRAHSTTVTRSATLSDGPEVHVALALDQNLKDQMLVVVNALVTNASRPLHLWILCRDHNQDDYTRLASLFPEVTATWLPCDTIDYGPVLGMLTHITVSTMDRLLLPDLLPELDRIVYHDIDALTLGDVAHLYDWNLDGQPIAARSAVAAHVTSGFANIMRSARRLRDDADAAYDLIRRMHARFAYDFVAFNAGILVLDLGRMRADRFSAEFLPFVEAYGMNDQEVLNCYAGPQRAVLPRQWNSLPTQEVVAADPQVIHWAGHTKPWMERYVLLKEHWSSYAETLGLREAGARRQVVTAPSAPALPTSNVDAISSASPV